MRRERLRLREAMASAPLTVFPPANTRGRVVRESRGPITYRVIDRADGVRAIVVGNRL